MAYDKNKIYEEAKEKIKEHNLFFIEDIVAFLPIVKQTFYDYFPLDSDEMDTLKALLSENKVNTKVELRNSFKSGQSVEKLALYKLIGTDEERRRLSQSYHDHTSKDEKLKVVGFLPEGLED
jgi:hypothetical protein